eukprot:1154190-Pelagomonas_calceolata.AAC.4
MQSGDVVNSGVVDQMDPEMRRLLEGQEYETMMRSAAARVSFLSCEISITQRNEKKRLRKPGPAACIKGKSPNKQASQGLFKSHTHHQSRSMKERKLHRQTKTLPTSIKERETHWLKEP